MIRTLIFALALALALAHAAASAASPKPMSLSTATKAVCDRAATRIQARYQADFSRITPELATFMRGKYATRFACGFRPAKVPDGSIPYYLLSVKRGTKPCTFVVTARMLWVNGTQPGYTGPRDETYRATCKGLRA